MPRVTPSLWVRRLGVFGVRNISALELEPSPKINVISGDNGHGKTSLLEAVYFLATSRSFRSDKLKEVCQDGSDITRVSASLSERDVERSQRIGVQHGRKKLSVDGKAPDRLSAYAVRTPVVVFHPGDLQLIAGTAALRRTLLDRIALFRNPASADHRARYRQAQRERQLLLETKGVNAPELDAFEALVSQHGAALQVARYEAADALQSALLPAFDNMAAADLELKLELAPAGCTDQQKYVEALRERRTKDARRKSASFGPHRDDLVLEINGRSARKHASQGQQRVLTLALKVAELTCVRQARGVDPLLLLDDVSSELDPTRTGAVYDFVRQTDSQVFVTTTRPGLFQTPDLQDDERADFRLKDGALIHPTDLA